MATLDFSSNKCYPLRMANAESEDARERLDRRVGATTVIARSQLYVYGGCVLGINLGANFKFEDITAAFEAAMVRQGVVCERYSDMLSNECFSLSLVKGKWTHYKVEQDEVPQARMFHSTTVYDNYLFVRGGVTFNEDNELVMLNDVWSFDTIDRKWHCFMKNGNDKIPYRFKDLTIYSHSLSVIGRPTHNGIIGVGGYDKHNVAHKGVYLFDFADGSVTKMEGTLTDPLTGEDLVLSNSFNALQVVECDDHPELRFLLFHKSLDPTRYQPLMAIAKDLRLEALTSEPGTDNTKISNLEFPILGKFGKHYVVTGYEKGKTRISSFVYNYTTNLWTKLQISCVHKVFAHKLSMGYVWSSHHKVIYLGTSSGTGDESPCIQYFDTMLALALPFTNILATQMDTSKSSPRNSVNLSRTSSHGSDSNTPHHIPRSLSQFHLQSLSNSPVSLVKTQPSTNTQSNIHQHVHHQHHHHHHHHHHHLNPGFEEYSNHVAQQIQVNSIQSVLPPYAIAIGKGAFHRTDAISDMNFICADGSVIPGNMTLCRRRWGAAFDLLVTDSYAKSLAMARLANTHSDLYAESEKSESSFDVASNKSRSESYNSNVPHFRYPFKDSESSSVTTANSQNAPSAPSDESYGVARRSSSRRTSIPYISPNPAAHRASLSISSRRNSHTMGSISRHNSISVPSRRNSLNLIQQVQSSCSRRGSTLSKSSAISGPSITSLSSPNLKPTYDPVGLCSQPPMAFHSGIPVGSEIRPTDDGNVYVQSLPPQQPMPTVMPNGQPFKEDSFDPFDRNADTTVESNSTQMESNSIPVTPLTPNMPTSEMPAPTTNNFDEVTSFHFGRLPRVMYLPFSRSTVQALNEYFYSGQVGANWKFFPTITELLTVSKRLGIPLLYDLLLEIVFVVVGIIESELNHSMSKEESSRHRHHHNCDHGGKDDYEVYCELLCEISNDVRRTSGSTLDSGFLSDHDIDQHAEKPNMSILQDDNLGPTDGGMSPNATATGVHGGDGVSLYELGPHKNTLSTLDEAGYYTSSENESDHEGGDDDVFVSRFKKFSIGSHKEDGGTGMDTSTDAGTGAGAGAEKRSEKLHEWPTVKDTLNTPVWSWLSITILDIAVETATLINDSHLLVRALHVRKLYHKLQDIRSQPTEKGADTSADTVDEGPKSMGVKMGAKLLRTASPRAPTAPKAPAVAPSVPSVPTTPTTSSAPAVSLGRPLSRRRSSVAAVSPMTPLAALGTASPAQSQSSLVPPATGTSHGSRSKPTIRSAVSSLMSREPTQSEIIPDGPAGVSMQKSPSQASLIPKKAKSIFGRFKRSN